MTFIADVAGHYGLTLHPLYLVLGAAGMLFAIAAGIQALWRHTRVKR